ncbi:Bromo adjacent -like proteiny domain-containing 1 protein [Collichthys lucidus]|uniref:Bromo adjacent-like proteiny domain-containing 1 protein n=1 Tax=Collichthys lucidus TaxID=240159 RepID=A0A4U5UM16_COLLU|nr:Bromo adjacent -like proteiny domain-containing 1 protein [Collichthys lucidus]
MDPIKSLVCPVEKHVMTHARQKGSLRQSDSSAEWWDNCPLWPHGGGTMGGAWPERSLRFGRTKKISEVVKPRKDPAKKMSDKRGRTEKSEQNRKRDRRRDKKRDRKLLASLNAEAVNSLLLERATDPQPAAKHARRQEEPTNGGASLDADPTRSGVPGGLKASRGNIRLQGSYCRLNPETALQSQTQGTLTKAEGEKGPSPAQWLHRPAKRRQDFEPKVEWETGSCTHRLTKPGYQSRSMLAYPLKQVKEEQLETELSPYYCCPPEGSMEYCHRLAFFLGQQPYGESDDQPLNSAMPPVKRECLVTSPSLTHSHPHTALTLSPHPCLCTADHCFSSYYVHIAHPTHTGATSASLAPRPLNFAPTSLCPNRMTGSKLLGPRVSHSSGLTHPAYCNSVASPCYGDACGISGYSYRAIPPVTSRGCSFSTGCTGCTHSIKTEGYSSPQGDHSPSLLVPPSLPMSSCPLSSVPTSTQTKPHLLTPLSGRDQPQAKLKLARECPQSNKPSNGSLSMGRTRLAQKQPSPLPSLSSTKQKRVSRRRATNGWRPVGMPTEREVFIACYEGVERDGEVIRVRDTVLLRSGPRKKSLPYVAKISALWEDPKTAHTVRFCALVKRRAEGAPPGSASMVPCRPDFTPPSHRCVPTDVDPELVYLCRHVYDFRYGRILKNLQ